jgi:hypothetical protein
MGIDWWRNDPFLSGDAGKHNGLEDRLRKLEKKVGLDGDGDDG